MRSWYGIRAGVAQPRSYCSIELSRHLPSSAPSSRSTSSVYEDSGGRSFTYSGNEKNGWFLPWRFQIVPSAPSLSASAGMRSTAMSLSPPPHRAPWLVMLRCQVTLDRLPTSGSLPIARS